MDNPEPTEGEGQRRRGISGGAIASCGGLALLIIFIAQNRQPVHLNFLAWSFSWPLWLYTIVIAVFGAFIWIGLGVIRRHRRRRERRQERRGR